MSPHAHALKAQLIPSISAVEIERLRAMRETYQALKKRLDTVTKTVDELESQVISQVEAGTDFSAMGYLVRIQETIRRYPAWKEHFLSRVGKAEADAILEATPPTIDKKLIIE